MQPEVYYVVNTDALWWAIVSFGFLGCACTSALCLTIAIYVDKLAKQLDESVIDLGVMLVGDSNEPSNQEILDAVKGISLPKSDV